MIKDTPVENDRWEQKSLARMEPEKREKVAEQIAQGYASTVREAVERLRPLKRIPSDAQADLAGTDAFRDIFTLRKLAKMPRSLQRQVAKTIGSGEADTVEKASQIILGRHDPQAADMLAQIGTLSPKTSSRTGPDRLVTLRAACSGVEHCHDPAAAGDLLELGLGLVKRAVALNRGLFTRLHQTVAAMEAEE